MESSEGIVGGLARSARRESESPNRVRRESQNQKGNQIKN